MTTGDITSPTSTVSTAQDSSEARKRGRGALGVRSSAPRGQASMISTASTAERATTRISPNFALPAMRYVRLNLPQGNNSAKH